MMSIHKLSAGDGYLYYMKEVTSGDDVRSRGQTMNDYYMETGNPSGHWMGSGAGRIKLSGQVTERQMELLFGLGLSPEYDTYREEALSRGHDPETAWNRAKLGRAYYRFNMDDEPFVVALNDAIKEEEGQQGRTLTDDQLRAVRLREAAKHFRVDKNRDPADAEELTKYLHGKLRGPSQAVAGYDLTFSPQKSVSTLWALADPDTARAIERCHQNAISSAMEYIERDVLRTRAGVNGVRQVEVEGAVAARFRHYESRTGDPQLHDHVVVANKVYSDDGVWRSIDGAALYRSAVAASEYYNQELAANLSDELGLEFDSVGGKDGKRPVLEVAGISDDVSAVFSQRREAIKDRIDTLVGEYQDTHGRAPSAKQMILLAQQATLETRPEKEGGKTLGELREAWRTSASEVLGDDGVDAMVEGALERESTPLEAMSEADVDLVSVSVVSRVSEGRAVWSVRHIEAEARRQLSHLHQGRRVDATIIERVVASAIGHHSIRLSGHHGVQIEARTLQRKDGTDVYTRHREEAFTSAELLDAEAQLVELSELKVLSPVSGETFDRVVQRFKDEGTQLSPSQINLAREFATSARMITAGIGPAGTGKTTTMRLFADALKESGAQMVALAPSRQAASVLGAELGTQATTIDSWLLTRNTLSPGDVVLIDEAGMAGTRKMREVVQRAEAAGAHVRLLGDYRQLSAVESGGALRLIHATSGGAELEDVFRFKNTEEREASLTLRDGDSSFGNPFQWYIDNDRAVAADAENAVATAFSAWQQDTNDGKNSLMLAPDNAMVDDMNSRAQAYRLAEGTVRLNRSVAVRGGHDAGVADIIVTRQNDSSLVVDGDDNSRFVTNGARWIIDAIDEEGGVSASSLNGTGQVYLPSDYVRSNVQLGYAVTVHRAQGATVDTAHAVLTPETSRNAAYVAMTRGKHLNMAYVVTDDSDSIAESSLQIAQYIEGSGSAHEAVRDAMVADADPVAVSHIHQDIAGYADRARMSEHLKAVADDRERSFPVARVLASDAWPVAVSRLVEAERDGWSPQHLLNAVAGKLDEVDDPAAALIARIQRVREAASELADSQTSFTNTSLSELRELYADARRRADRARDDMAVLEARSSHKPKPVTLKSGAVLPPWNERPFGHLDYDALVSRIDVLTLAADAEAEFEQDSTEAQDEAAAAIAERNNRWAMRWPDRGREDFQRARAADPDRTIDPTQVSTFDLEQAEQRYAGATDLAESLRNAISIRRRLPDRDAAPETSNGLPDWFAPAAALSDSFTPSLWRAQMSASYNAVQSKASRLARRLEEDAPAWAATLHEDDVLPVALWRLEHGVPEHITHPMPVTDPDQLPASQRPLYERVISRMPKEEAVDLQRRLAAIRSEPDVRLAPSASEMRARVDELRKRAQERDDANRQNTSNADHYDTRADVGPDSPQIER